MRKSIVTILAVVLVAVAATPSMVMAQTAAAAPAAAASAPAIKTNGFWLEAKLRTAVTFGATTGVAGISTYALPSFVIGGKFGRMVLGLGLDLLTYDAHEPSEDQPSREKWFGFILGPVLQVIVATKGPLAAYAQLAVGFRYVWGKDKYWGDVEKTTAMGPAFNMGIGFRYFLHRNFALGTEFGANVDVTWSKVKETNMDPAKTRTTMATLYGALTAATLW